MRFRLRRISAKIRRRSYRWRPAAEIVPLVMLAFIFFILVFSGYRLLTTDAAFDHSLARSLLRLGMPNLAESEPGAADPFDLRSFVYFLTDYDLYDPLSILKAVLPFVQHGPEQLRVWEERPFVFIQELSFAPDPVRPSVPAPAQERVSPTAAAQVLIYHTHTSEMYLGHSIPASQSSRAHYQFRNSADPTVTGVMAAGRHLANALNSLGIGTKHETTIHTLPNINHSYGNSEKTVREILSRHKDLKMVIDLHRDAGVPGPSLMIDGRSVAKLCLVVGTAESVPLSHPNFQENLAFAHKIKAVCDEMYPGLMRAVQVQKQARYNQHLHPHSVIVELGSVENTLEEALLAAELLAKVLVRVL